MGQGGRVKQTVKDGVAADQVQDTGRSATALREMVRSMVEAGIVRLHAAYKREHLMGQDVDLLQRYVKLLNELEGKLPEADKPGTGLEGASLEELAKAAKR